MALLEAKSLVPGGPMSAAPKVEGRPIPEIPTDVPPLAFISDLHIGASTDTKHGPLMTGDGFVDMCRGLVVESKKLHPDRNYIPAAVFAGDTLDKDASLDEIAKVQEGLEILASAGIEVLFVLGNNEDRILRRPELNGKLFTFGPKARSYQEKIHVLDDGLIILNYKDALDYERQVAFVVASRVIDSVENTRIWGNSKQQHEQPDDETMVSRILANRVEANKKLDKFKENLRMTAEEYDPVTGEWVRRPAPIPTYVIHHAPEDPRKYRHLARFAEHPAVMASAAFTWAMIEHDRIHGNVKALVHGHVEDPNGKPKDSIHVPGQKPILCYDACGVLVGAEMQCMFHNDYIGLN